MLWSPNFDRFLEIDYNLNCLVIKQVFAYDEPPVIIPREFIAVGDVHGQTNKSQIANVVRRVWFLSLTVVRIVTEKGLDLLISAENGKVLSRSKIANFK